MAGALREAEAPGVSRRPSCGCAAPIDELSGATPLFSPSGRSTYRGRLRGRRFYRCGVGSLDVADVRGRLSHWTATFDFNHGAVGEKVAGLDAGGGTTYTARQVFEGGQAAQLTALRGKENYGRWGGRVVFPSRLVKGDEIWWRVRTWWPKGMDYSAAPRLKFLRVHTCTATGENRGYNDIYINPPGSEVPFQYIYEGEHRWRPVSGAEDAIVPDTWETYELYLKLDEP